MKTIKKKLPLIIILAIVAGAVYFYYKDKSSDRL